MNEPAATPMQPGGRTRIRGLMLDAARLVEPLDHYRRFLDFCAEWGINTVMFRLTDDQGCAMRFRSHPELITHEHALTPGEVHSLAVHANAVGIDLIPEIESLGHSHYITRTAAHADLNDQAADGPGWANALIPLHPKTLQLLGDLYAETAELFPSRYLHAGCDETNWGGSPFSRDLLATRSRAQVWGEYLNALHARVQALGREMIVWDDMVLQHDPTVLEHLDRRIILHDWEYAGTDPAPIAARLQLALDKGFRMLGGPALCWCKWGPRPGAEQLCNIEAYADVYRASSAPSTLGVVVTNWVPSRYLQGAMWDGLAYAAVAVGDGSAAARESALKRFVERHYGATWDAAWAQAFAGLYASAPTRQGDRPVRLPVPWGNDEELQRAVAAPPVTAPPFEALLAEFAALQPQVRRQGEDFAALHMTLAYLVHLCWRQQAVRGKAGAELAAVLPEIARRDAAMAAALESDWCGGRFGDPLAGLAQAQDWGFGPEDWLHGRFLAAARFTRQYLTAGEAPGLGRDTCRRG